MAGHAFVKQDFPTLRILVQVYFNESFNYYLEFVTLSYLLEQVRHVLLLCFIEFSVNVVFFIDFCKCFKELPIFLLRNLHEFSNFTLNH